MLISGFQLNFFFFFLQHFCKSKINSDGKLKTFKHDPLQGPVLPLSLRRKCKSKPRGGRRSPRAGVRLPSALTAERLREGAARSCGVWAWGRAVVRSRKRRSAGARLGALVRAVEVAQSCGSCWLWRPPSANSCRHVVGEPHPDPQTPPAAAHQRGRAAARLHHAHQRRLGPQPAAGAEPPA